MTKVSRRRFLYTGVAALSGAALSACSPEKTEDAPPIITPPGIDIEPVSDPIPNTVDQVSVRILWTGDTHGHLRPIFHREPFDESFLDENNIERDSVEAYCSSWFNFEELAAKYGKIGGWANIATLVKQERGTYPDQTILLDSGDTWYGSGIALKTNGAAPVAVMNAMGYDAMTLHWEFNLGKETFFERVDEAEFAVIAQNLVDTDFEDRLLETSIVRQFGDITVAVVGEAYPFSLLASEDAELNPGMRMGYRDVELQEEIARLRNEEGADIVILLSHMGYLQDIVMAERLEGVDVIIGGHTHDISWKPIQVGNTLIMHGGSHGKFLGRIDLEVKDGALAGYDYQLMPVLADQIEADPEISALIDELYAPFEDEFAEVIGETEFVLYRHSLFGGTSDAFMGNAYRAIAGSQLACSGGWRFGSTILPGPVTVEDIYNAMKPTPTPLFTATLLGSQLRETIEDNLDNVFNPDPLQRLGGDVSRCTGIKAIFDPNGQRMARLIDPTVDGEPLDDAQTYTLATSGGRTQTRDPNYLISDLPSVEELINYIRENPTISQEEPVRAFTPKL